MKSKYGKERLFEVMGKLDKTFKPTLNENIFDRFTIEVNRPDYKGTIKRDRTGWMLYDVTDSPEEAGPFGDLRSLMDYYDIDKTQMTGDYVRHLREEDKVAPENLAVSSVGGVVESPEQTTKNQYKYMIITFNRNDDITNKEIIYLDRPDLTKYDTDLPMKFGTNQGLIYIYEQ